ncbi:hypothetical protein PbB2_01228 [Candidatus Phycosocius bacilliformis]|uniref:ATP-binding protein n=1 Tax=Candidatus Phycosocius bacilliformis TaxID=1445552 RepID=A0A2P2E932_9PROT|nr:ATP-binding protein [Candidatus Phycosocius bacilliformis]GBF57561.1 hypothetical protein PbB2_01228 [Candidatus Phycosocius bacilliformis]
MTDPAFHLVCGSTGAGKSTYSRKLAADLPGLYLAIDRWMVELFWPDSPQPIEFDWTMARIGRCEAMITEMALQAIGLGRHAILDLGFTTADHRRRFADVAKERGIPVVLHVLDVPVEVRWGRVQARNADKGETFSLTVDREMFDFVETMWEVPNREEMSALNGCLITD